MPIGHCAELAELAELAKLAELAELARIIVDGTGGIIGCVANYATVDKGACVTESDFRYIYSNHITCDSQTCYYAPEKPAAYTAETDSQSAETKAHLNKTSNPLSIRSTKYL
jgi:hypothetical protein